MAFSDHEVDLAAVPEIRETLRANTYLRQVCEVHGNGEKIRGVATIGQSEGHARVYVEPDNRFFEIPLNEITRIEVIEPRSEDTRFMKKAIEQARLSKFENEKRGNVPAPFVGAVVVRNGLELDSCHRGEDEPGEHAEFGLLDKKLKENSEVAGATLYTTLEPCTKRRPDKIPCVERIKSRRIQRVVVGMLDPNQAIRGEGIWILREAGIEVDLCAIQEMTEIEDMNRSFVWHFRRPPGAPPPKGFWNRLQFWK